MAQSKKFWRWVLAFSAIDLVFVIILRLVFGKDQYGFVGIAFFMAIALVLQLVAGIIINYNEKEKLYGKALLLSTAIMLVVGFGICTIGN